jgi:hypothetical protein
MIKSNLGDQFATIATDVQAFINVLTLRCKQLLSESLNLPTTNFSLDYGGRPGFNFFKNTLYE